MSYTVTCPDPECKTTFEVDAETFDAAYQDDEALECPTCETEFEWDYDPGKPDGQEITLTVAVEYEEEGEDLDDIDPDDEEEG